MKDIWVVYILKCRMGYLYTGVTNNLDGRVTRHNQGRGALFTRGYRPCELLWHEHHLNRSDAQRREYEIKHWRREKKLTLAKGSPSPCSKCAKF